MFHFFEMKYTLSIAKIVPTHVFTVGFCWPKRTAKIPNIMIYLISNTPPTNTE